MYIKRIFLLLFLISSHFAMSQNLSLKKKAESIDSLMTMYYSNYEQAEREANRLYGLLITKYTAKEYKDIKVKVMLQKCILYSLNGNHHKALQIALEALDEAEKHQLPEKMYQSCWTIAMMYEVGGQLNLCKKYLDRTYSIYEAYKLDNIYSSYCTRMSSYYIRIHKNDSAIYYAYKGLDYAQKYNNKRELRDAHLLLGIALPENEALKHKLITARTFIEIKDFTSAASLFTDIASVLFKRNQIDEAFRYSDSAFIVLKGTNAYVNPNIYELRSKLFDAVGNKDSAYYYFRKYHDVYVNEQSKMENSKMKQISEQYQNDKKETVIKNKNQQIILIGSLLAVIVIVLVLLFLQNRRIKSRNKIINKQLAELSKTLEQKQMLLSELQHRVKNNLQHVISILEIQKESVDFNNIDELIRGNQNRIHSMALLHKKLNVSESVNDVDLKRYVTELSELVKESYDNHKRKIALSIKCEVETISIEKALPIGLIITELVSNSMKHAFRKQNIGIITVEITKNETGNQIYYADNGIGFDFNKVNEKGLGQEIIKGLIDQLNGNVTTKSDNGFELTVHF